jgi:hypothetical protein
VVVGHLTGLVQVYQPAARPDTTSRPEDLLVEQQLTGPVLQLLCGTYVTGTDSGSFSPVLQLFCGTSAICTGSSILSYNCSVEPT